MLFKFQLRASTAEILMIIDRGVHVVADLKANLKPNSLLSSYHQSSLTSI